MNCDVSKQRGVGATSSRPHEHVATLCSPANGGTPSWEAPPTPPSGPRTLDRQCRDRAVRRSRQWSGCRGQRLSLLHHLPKLLAINKAQCRLAPAERQCIIRKDSGCDQDALLSTLGNNRAEQFPHFVDAGPPPIPLLALDDRALPSSMEDQVNPTVRASSTTFFDAIPESLKELSHQSATMSYMAARDTVGVREIRQNLSVYLERVKRGEALEITERGQPVAIIAPLPEHGSLVARLVAAGRVTPPTRAHARLVAPSPAPEGAPSISGILDDLREDRF